MRVLVTGMGGELGTRVAQLLEEETAVTEIAGIDFVPPAPPSPARRVPSHSTRLQRDRLRDFVLDFAPTAVAHFGVYEPASRMGPAQGRGTHRAVHGGRAVGGPRAPAASSEWCSAAGSRCTAAGAAPRRCPTSRLPPEPATPYGQSLLQVEAVAAGLSRRHGVSVASMRYAPVVGSHVPSPIGRLLRLPVVPVPATTDPPFQLLHPEDACVAMVRALMLGYDGPLNVAGVVPRARGRRCGSAAVCRCQCCRGCGRGRRAWSSWPARRSRRTSWSSWRSGCTGSGDRAVSELGLAPPRPTQQVLTELYQWAGHRALVPAKAVA